MIHLDHNRLSVRPLVVAVQGHGGAFCEVLATRAERDPDLALHLLAALDAVQAAFPETVDPDRACPKLPAEAAYAAFLVRATAHLEQEGEA